jgi:alpha-L-fucosidase
MGDWLQANGEAVYGTVAGPIQGLGWCRTTAKPGVVYLHVFNWPPGGQITAPGLGQVSKVHLLSDAAQAPLNIECQGSDLLIAGPAQAPDPTDTVLVLTTGA